MKKKGTDETKAAVERILERAAQGCTWLDFGGPLERLICEILTPGCQPDGRNERGLIRLIACLEEVAKVASQDDWLLVCSALKGYAYNWSDESTKAMLRYTQAIEDEMAESEVSHAR